MSCYFKNEVICNTKENGKLEVVDFESLNYTFKIKWIIDFLKN